MPTPLTYYHTQAELDAVKGMAFLLLMSEEVPSIDGELASQLFNVVGAMTEEEAKEAIKAYGDTQ